MKREREGSGANVHATCQDHSEHIIWLEYLKRKHHLVDLKRNNGFSSGQYLGYQILERIHDGRRFRLLIIGENACHYYYSCQYDPQVQL